MKLVNYGIGEVADRLTILDLKLAHGGGDHFKTERHALLTKVRPREIAPWFEHVLTLATVNGLLWRAEDDLRDWRRQATDLNGLGPEARAEVADLAFRIQELNDQRASVIEAINKLAADHLGPEKING